MKKEMLGKMKMPAKKKDPMLDLEATLAEIGQEKPDSEMDSMEEEDSSEYESGPEIGGEKEMEGEGGQDLAMFTDEELQEELDKRLSLSSSKPSKKMPKM